MLCRLSLRFWLSIGLGGVLAVACTLLLYPATDREHFKPPRNLVNLLGQPPPGWRHEDRSLGDTEFMDVMVRRILRFNDAFFRVYYKGNLEVGVYLVYWQPGQIDNGSIALHTPDVCWVGNGAERLEFDDNRNLRSDLGPLQPGNFRVFRWPQARQEVIFWHLYGGQPSGFPIPEGSSLRGRFNEFRQVVSNTSFGRFRNEQVFLRISTNRSIDEVTRSELWPVLVQGLHSIGLLKESPAR